MKGTEHDALATHNERIKLFAAFVNAVGIGLIGLGILGPITQTLDNASLSALWWGLVGLVLHGGAHYILGYIRKETSR